jgi:hypothetical protein
MIKFLRHESTYNHECSDSVTVKVKVKHPVTRHGGAWGERRYSSYLFSTSALDGG